jgi:hypothetical protein
MCLSHALHRRGGSLSMPLVLSPVIDLCAGYTAYPDDLPGIESGLCTKPGYSRQLLLVVGAYSYFRRVYNSIKEVQSITALA